MPQNSTIDTFGGRLKFLIESLKDRGVTTESGKMNGGVFAGSIGIAPTQFSRILNNEFGMTMPQIMQVC